MQSSIAVLAYVALVIIDRWSSAPASRQLVSQRKVHVAAWITAIAEFHKTQFYFAAAVQIAAMVFTLDIFGVNSGSHLC